MIKLFELAYQSNREWDNGNKNLSLSNSVFISLSPSLPFWPNFSDLQDHLLFLKRRSWKLLC